MIRSAREWPSATVSRSARSAKSSSAGGTGSGSRPRRRPESADSSKRRTWRVASRSARTTSSALVRAAPPISRTGRPSRKWSHGNSPRGVTRVTAKRGRARSAWSATSSACSRIWRMPFRCCDRSSTSAQAGRSDCRCLGADQKRSQDRSSPMCLRIGRRMELMARALRLRTTIWGQATSMRWASRRRHSRLQPSPSPRTSPRTASRMQAPTHQSMCRFQSGRWQPRPGAGGSGATACSCSSSRARTIRS